MVRGGFEARAASTQIPLARQWTTVCQADFDVSPGSVKTLGCCKDHLELASVSWQTEVAEPRLWRDCKQEPHDQRKECEEQK